MDENTRLHAQESYEELKHLLETTDPHFYPDEYKLYQVLLAMTLPYLEDEDDRH